MISHSMNPNPRPGKAWVLLPLLVVCLGVSWSAAQQNGQKHDDQPGPLEDRITLNIEDADIAEVLKLLSLRRRLNIVAGKDISGRVSINLYDVPFETALRVILEINGFTFYRRENVIFVTKAAEEPGAILRSSRAVMRTFRLNYVNVDEAARMVENLLSRDGKMVVGKETKTLLVEATADTLEKIGTLLQDLDTRPRQVLIEAKILEVDLDNETTVGIDWNAVFGGTNSLGGRVGNTFTQSFATNPLSGAPGFFFRVIDEDISILIGALQEHSTLNTIASPKILAIDGKEAQILIGQKLGFRVTTTTETSTLESVEFLDVGTELVIRPLISDDGYILMYVHPKVSDGVIEAGLPSETTTEATTSVLVKDGATIVIGGLIREREDEINRQVPGLGDLPLLGALFRRRTTRKAKTEIAVLITPHIVRETLRQGSVPETSATQPQVRRVWDTEFVMALSHSL